MNKKNNISEPMPTAAVAGSAEAAEQSPALEASGAARTEVERLVEAVVARQLERLRRELEERFAQARGEGRAEAERLAGMSEDERRRYEADAVRAREDQLAQREAELDRRELRAWLSDELIARGLPGELGEVVDCGDRARCEAGLLTLERLFRAAVQRGVDERIGRGHSLPRASGEAQTGMIDRMRAAAGLNS